MTRPPSYLIALLSAVWSAAALAQTHKVAAPERVTRAIAVYEWTGPLEKPTADRLVPVSIFINGRMEDADVYLARPVPLALQTGNVYEIDQAGQKKGLYGVDRARNAQVFAKVASDSGAGGWLGFGKFTAPAKAKATPLQPSRQLPTINSTAGSARSQSVDERDTSASKRSDTAKSSDTESDHPRLNQPTDSGSNTNAKNDDVDRPTLRKRDPADETQRRKAASQSGVRGPDVSLNDDPDRPTIRHGKPASAESAQELTGLPADLHQAAAVSDATDRNEHVFAREWESSAERTETLGKLESMARPLLAKYIADNQLIVGPAISTPAAPAAPPLPTAVATPPSSTDDENAPKLQRGVPKEYQSPTATPKARTPAPVKKPSGSARVSARAKAPAIKSASGTQPISIAEEQLTPYTLSYGGLPTFVYSAQVSLKTGGPVYITMVAQRMVSGDFQTALTSITDASHLDRTPWLRLVDAVDPDASHRASLLFELRAQSSRQFALYRLTSAKAEQTFVTNTM